MILYDLYIIYRDGRNIYHKNFSESNLDPSIISGFLSALNNFAQEALPSEGALNEIEKGDVKLLFNYGKYLTTVLIAETKDDNTVAYLNSRLKLLTDEIEKKYSEVLKEWGGDLSEFENIDAIISEIFKDVEKLSTPPPIEELLNRKEYYFYSVSENSKDIYDIFYNSSDSFTEFLNVINFQKTTADKIIEKLVSSRLSLVQIKDEFNLDFDSLAKFIRHLALRGIINVYG
ncbi:MAG: hypothetical protein ACTSQY_04455 [Candidatus Odinarchaeia archaeon]